MLHVNSAGRRGRAPPQKPRLTRNTDELGPLDMGSANDESLPRRYRNCPGRSSCSPSIGLQGRCTAAALAVLRRRSTRRLGVHPIDWPFWVFYVVVGALARAPFRPSPRAAAIWRSEHGNGSLPLKRDILSSLSPSPASQFTWSHHSSCLGSTL